MIRLKLVIFSIIVTVTQATLDPSGAKCGQTRCSTTEYCSPYDFQCKPCSLICDPTSHNHHAEVCVRDCQEYLHDQRYVLRADLGRDGNLRDEVQRLTTLVKISLIATFLTIIAMIIFLAKSFLNVKRIRETFNKVFGKNWTKTANNNKVYDDAENGTMKSQQQSGIKSTMPTISATVSESSTQDSNASSTPNTTSTPLSKRYASEDTTLEFAYDNLAMTPSPESTAQPKSKKESSF